jgi:hypothetical protein
MGYAFIGPSGSHAEQLRNALHNLRRHVQDGEPLDEFYLDVPQLLETAVDYISADVELRVDVEGAESRCPHGRIIDRRLNVAQASPMCTCCRWLYIDPLLDGSTSRCLTCR